MKKIPEKMTASILADLNQNLIIDTVHLPGKLLFGQVLVKVCYSTICGSQIGEIQGVKGTDPYLPHLLGHEGSGIVIATGEGVKSVKENDHVVMHWMPGNGIQSELPRYTWNNKPLNAGYITTFNEYAIVSENRLTSIPKEFDLKIAPLFGCAVTTGLGVINNKAQIKIGDSVIIVGAGGVGLSMIQGASMVSAYPVIAVDLYEEKLKLAQKMGASHTINVSHLDMKNEVNNILNNSMVDVAIDNTGNTTMIESLYQLISSQGKLILAGVPKLGDNISIYSLPLHFGKSITGTKGGECNPTIDIPKYIQLYNIDALKLDEMITDNYLLSDINDAIHRMNSGEIAGRCLLSISDTV